MKIQQSKFINQISIKIYTIVQRTITFKLQLRLVANILSVIYNF